MRLVVKFQGVVSVGEVLLSLRLFLCVLCDPVKKFGAVARVFGVSRLVCLERAVMPLPFFFHCYRAVPAEIFRKIIAADERCGVYNCPATLLMFLFIYFFFIQEPFLELVGIIFWPSRYCLRAMLPAITTLNFT